ncbi:MAG TPA: N-formylglutamate amidohydrolase [Burkholderiaceae bacterium]|nr:N-formylglutamate amidohydrolase [Burkholderiaceae bacterium]
METLIDWISAGQTFAFDDLVFWQGKGALPFGSVAARIDTIVLGPHAGARFPAELQPFIDPALTRRKQYDYSDVITGSLGRAWAAADPGVVFVECPHARVVLDPNRAPPTDAIVNLRAFFDRLQRQRAGESVGFAGVDAIRPITFSGETVLRQPASEAEWAALAAALAAARSLGHDAYRSVGDEVIEMVLEKRPKNATLMVVGLHDTMNTKMRADGALVLERPVADRLPALVNFGNKGDASGEFVSDSLSLDAAAMRRVAGAWADGFKLDATAQATAITLNHPYAGGYEIGHYGAILAASQRPHVGAFQVEFLREALLGPAATAHLHLPGGDWPAVDEAHLKGVVSALVEAGRLLRA